MADKRYLDIIEKLNINEDEIVDDLSAYYNHVKGRYMQKAKIEKTWGSVENYVNVLYWLKFVMKLNHYEMDELTNMVNFYEAYKDLGWYYNSFDFNECETMHREEVARLKSIYDEYDANSEIFSSADYLSKRETIVLKKNSVTRLVNNYNVTDIDELVKRMYFLVYEKKLITSEIATLFGKDRLTVAKVIKSFNMNISRKEARKRIEESGRGNHRQSIVGYKQAMVSKAIKNGVTSNNSENICRASIETKLYSYFDIEKYEFIVGLSSCAIVPPKEIDIPILIYEKTTNKYYRYAVELDGSFWHKNNLEKDIEKNNYIEMSNWKLIRILYKAREKTEKKIEEGFRKVSDDVCKIIISDVKGEDTEWHVKSVEGF